MTTNTTETRTKRRPARQTDVGFLTLLPDSAEVQAARVIASLRETSGDDPVRSSAGNHGESSSVEAVSEHRRATG